MNQRLGAASAVFLLLLALGCILCLFSACAQSGREPVSSSGTDHAADGGETAVPTAQDSSGTEPAATSADADVPPGEPEDPLRDRALSILAEMTTEEKLCQLMIVNPGYLTGIHPTREAGSREARALADYPVGGFSFGASSLQTREQVTGMLTGLREMTKPEPFFCIDEEGGTVCRVMSNPELGTTWVDSMFEYKDLGPETAFDNASTIGGDIAGMGFNVDFAPVADVWNNPENKVIGKRAYSDSFSQAEALIPAAVRGFHAAGVICTLKHFPGHGSTVTDSHKGLPILTQTEQELEQAELLPFRAGIEAGADLVMIGHLMVPELDPDYPASLSHAVVTGLLRQKLGYSGAVITDALGMGALSSYTEPEKCILALNAGCDILLGVTNVPEALRGLTDALEDGTLSQERVDESVLRILMLKLAYGIIPPEDGA